MGEKISFHFEGGVADANKMNFYESARFQYASARLLVKLAQFRSTGRFVKHITNSSNFNIELLSHSEGSFNINVEAPHQPKTKDEFINISISELIAYISERLVEKLDAVATVHSALTESDAKSSADLISALDRLAGQAANDGIRSLGLSQEIEALVKRRMAESQRVERLAANNAAISRIDPVRSQKLIAMSAPLISEMATALRRSAGTLEIETEVNGQNKAIMFLDEKMAREIETASVDEEITPILGDITQFNKDNGYGKLKINGGVKVLNFSVPSDLLQLMKQKILDNMKKDLVYLQTYFVRDRSGQVVRLIAVGVLPTPDK